MLSLRQLRSEFTAAVDDADSVAAADRLCRACVALLGVDGAALSIVSRGVMWGTIGASGLMSRRLDELQFTFGEGPCFDAVHGSMPVHAADLGGAERRWPAFSGAAVAMGVRAVLALPVTVGGQGLGALDLFRHQPGAPTTQIMGGGILAAEIAGIPLQKSIDGVIEQADVQSDADEEDADSSWDRVEVYQATGMIMGRLNIGADEALVRLRGYAFCEGLTAGEVARRIVHRELSLPDDKPKDGHPGGDG